MDDLPRGGAFFSTRGSTLAGAAEPDERATGGGLGDRGWLGGVFGPLGALGAAASRVSPSDELSESGISSQLEELASSGSGSS